MKKFLAGVISLFVIAAASSPAAAQDAATESPAADDQPVGEQPATPTTPQKKALKKKQAAESEEKDAESDADAAETPALPAAKEKVEQAATEGAVESQPPATPKPPAQPKVAVEPAVPAVDAQSPFGEPGADGVDREFVPLEEIQEGALEQIIPAKVHPRVEWNGTFRTRVGAAVNYDLDTEGTSAILPPAEAFTPAGDPVSPDRDTHWDANLRLKLDPTLYITEALWIHTEVDLLDNVVFGSLPASRLGADLVQPDLTRRTGVSNAMSPREREWFDNALSVNEVYGAVDTVFGTFSAGRMDDAWGLGIFLNDGDCLDCNYGTHVDRFRFETKFWELYGAASLDFPDEGVTSKSAMRNGGQPYDLSQRDDVDQYTFQIFRTAKTREEKELQGKRLLDDKAPVFNGGAMYRYRRQEGRFIPAYTGTSFDPASPGELAYRGEQIHIADLWAQFLYQPDFNTRVRVEVEAIGAFGRVDNVSDLAVGLAEPGQPAPNCFDNDEFGANETACTTNSNGESTRRDVRQFGLALESEIKLDSPVSFGFNGGFATGGSTANWGTSGLPDLKFYRFSPDYDVDLILFRNVIGTVTNAYYFNPYAMIEFLESSSSHLELQIDGIGSRAFDVLGTPSGTNPWLGLEFDAALRFVNLDVFTAALEAGILFPFDGLAGVPGRPRNLQFGANPEEYNADFAAQIAWTVQAKLFWNF